MSPRFRLMRLKVGGYKRMSVLARKTLEEITVTLYATVKAHNSINSYIKFAINV